LAGGVVRGVGFPVPVGGGGPSIAGGALGAVVALSAALSRLRPLGRIGLGAGPRLRRRIGNGAQKIVEPARRRLWLGEALPAPLRHDGARSLGLKIGRNLRQDTPPLLTPLWLRSAGPRGRQKKYFVVQLLNAPGTVRRLQGPR